MPNNKNITVIPAKFQAEKRKKRKMRVAAYCRVSTDSEEQKNSYQNQLTYYWEKISTNPDWEPVKVFADEGVSGVSTRNRDAFNEMMDMCRAGKIDVILTKSIHRFARNTLDAVKYVRMLRAVDVNVIFEQEGLQGINPADEQIIAIYASMAQNYSQNLSDNVKWGFKRSFAKGAVYFGGRMYGYRQNGGGKVEIIPEEAEVVRLIFSLYLSGWSMGSICRELERRRIPTAKGGAWGYGAIDHLLSNEKYTGDAICQKTFMQDVLTKKQVKNMGQLPQYYVENSHEAIISKETFKQAQFERTRRKSLAPVSAKTKTNAGRFTSKYALSGLILCGECGHYYRRITWYRKNAKKIVWRCSERYENGKRVCRESPAIPEPAIHRALTELIVKLANGKEVLMQKLKDYAGEVMEQETGDARKQEIQRKMEQTDSMIQAMLNADLICEEQIQALSGEHEKLEQELAQLGELHERREQENAHLQGVEEYIQNADFSVIQYDDKLIREIVEQMIVRSKERIYVRFKGGYEMEIRLDTGGE